MVLENPQLGVKKATFLTPNCLRGVRGLSSLTFEIKTGIQFLLNPCFALVYIIPILSSMVALKRCRNILC